MAYHFSDLNHKRNLMSNCFSNLKRACSFRFMNAAYFLTRFEEFERENVWDELFHTINVLSDEQEKHLGYSYEISNYFDNAEKNRYRNVLPYDQNRVTLACSSKSDYINASPLSIPFANRDYILTQGPLPNTSEDFWQMIYEKNVSVIIMLSKIMEKNFIKCHSYFPKKEKTIEKFEYCECKLLVEEVKPHYIIRQIRITFIEPTTNKNTSEEKTNEAEESAKPNSRIIYHFQYMTWPDFGVPENTEHFLEFLSHVRNQYSNSHIQVASNEEVSKESDKESKSEKRSPIVCHCSAGIGRTGAFVIIDSVLNILEKNQEKQKEDENLYKASKNVKKEILKENVNALPVSDGVNDKANSSTNVEKISISAIDNDDNPDVQLKKLKPDTQSFLLKKLPPSASNEVKVASNNTKKDSTNLGIKISPSFDSATSGTNSLAVSPSNDSIIDENLMTLVDFVVYIRRSRMGLIQTPQQLRFCWKAIVNWINNNIEINKK